MKIKILVLLFIFSVSSPIYSQLIEGPINEYGMIKVLFKYDAAGNQIQRELCINCPLGTGRFAQKEEIGKEKNKEIEEIVEEKNKEIEGTISFYPNPASEELNVEWNFQEHIKISSLLVYTIQGKLVMQYDKLHEKTFLKIPFSSLSAGTYLVVYSMANGEKKSIKILKK